MKKRRMTIRHPPLIGIYTRASDDHLERVVTELQRRHYSWVRFDSSDFPQGLELAARFDPGEQAWQGEFLLGGTIYRLEEVRSIWYRRPSKRYAFPPGLSEAGYEYAKAEAQKGFGGLLHGLSTRWVSHPDAIGAAAWKPQQLAYARQVGLRIPKTLITNDAQAAFQFFEECRGEMIYKPFTQGVPRPRRGESWEGAVYTTKLTRALLVEHAPDIALTAHLFQEAVPKAFELRITVIGTRVFAAEIHSQHSDQAKVDFRLGYPDLIYGVHQLPPAIEHGCLALVQRFRLRFAAIDMIVTPHGDYIFLEVNGNGQWGWIEQQTGLPLTEALVDLLAMDE
jgi:glutathione synthase/RimK-type ligase-like ATP-grasp enzyme